MTSFGFGFLLGYLVGIVFTAIIMTVVIKKYLFEEEKDQYGRE